MKIITSVYRPVVKILVFDSLRSVKIGKIGKILDQTLIFHKLDINLQKDITIIS